MSLSVTLWPPCRPPWTLHHIPSPGVRHSVQTQFSARVLFGMLIQHPSAWYPDGSPIRVRPSSTAGLEINHLILLSWTFTDLDLDWSGLLRSTYLDLEICIPLPTSTFTQLDFHLHPPGSADLPACPEHILYCFLPSMLSSNPNQSTSHSTLHLIVLTCRLGLSHVPVLKVEKYFAKLQIHTYC